MTEWLEKAFGGLPQTAPRPPPVEPPKKGACAGSEAALRACLETHTTCFEGNPDATPAECANWPNLTQIDCAAVAALQPPFPRQFRVPTGHAAPNTYRCGWESGRLTQEQRLLAPAAYVATHDAGCGKRTCGLYENARSIAPEFGCLFLMAAYGTTYALADLRWSLRLTRRESATAATVVSVNHTPPLDELGQAEGGGGGAEEDDVEDDVVKLLSRSLSVPPPAAP